MQYKVEHNDYNTVTITYLEYYSDFTFLGLQGKMLNKTFFYNYLVVSEKDTSCVIFFSHAE